MPSFGDTLKNLYQKADEFSKTSFNAVAKPTQKALDSLAQGYGAAKDKAKQAYEYSENKARETYDYGKDKAQQAYGYAKDKANAAKDYAATQYSQAKQSVRQTIAAAKEAVDKQLNPQPAGAAIQSCPNTTKAGRVQARNQKIQAGKNKLKSMPPGPARNTLAHATERLERNNYAVERARLAADTYNVGKGDPPEGWERVSKEEMKKLGIDTRAFPQFRPGFNPDEYKDGFYPELYKSKADVFGEEKYVLGLRGTQGKVDWLEGNAKQAIGLESEHYEQAKNIARNLQQTLSANGKNLEVTGHSLGGGLTTAASIVAGVPGFAFDPAGVHPNTLERAGKFSREQADKLVQNYFTEGEILTTVQDPSVQRGIMAGGVALGGNPVAFGMGAVGGRAIAEKGTMTYGAAGPLYKLPALANAHEVAAATARGNGIQGMTSGLGGRLNNQVNPLQKVELHDMDYAIAGLEQQKADDLAVVDQNLGQ